MPDVVWSKKFFIENWPNISKLKIELEIKNLIASYIMSKILKFSNWILCGKQTHLHKHNLERFNSILMHWSKTPFQTQVHLSSNYSL